MIGAGGVVGQVPNSLLQDTAVCFALRPLAFGFRVDSFCSRTRPHIQGADLSVLAYHTVQVKTMSATFPDHLALLVLAYAVRLLTVAFRADDLFLVTVFSAAAFFCGAAFFKPFA